VCVFKLLFSSITQETIAAFLYSESGHTETDKAFRGCSSSHICPKKN